MGEECRRNAADGGTKRSARPGLRLCPGCLTRLVATVEELPGLYAECERLLGGGGPARGGGERRGTGGAPAGIPLNGPAAEVRSAIVATLASWSGLIADERRFPAPRRNPAHLAAFVLRSAEWLAAHPAAADATRELHRLARAARRVARAEPAREVPVGPCVEPGCTGRLAVPPGARHIECDADHAHRWGAPDWSRLRRAAAPESGERWLTARDIAELFGAATGTVYRLASEQRWRRRNLGGRTYYAETDVHTTFSRRRTPATTASRASAS
ncbi:helix-turn-helix domain-containing protein [Streptomyces sp. NPDC004788]